MTLLQDIREYVESRLRDGWLMDRFEEMTPSVALWAAAVAVERIIEFIPEPGYSEAFRPRLDTLRAELNAGALPAEETGGWYVPYLPFRWYENRASAGADLHSKLAVTHLVEMPRAIRQGCVRSVMTLEWYETITAAVLAHCVHVTGLAVAEIVDAGREPEFDDANVQFLYEWWQDVENGLAVRDGLATDLLNL